MQEGYNKMNSVYKASARKMLGVKHANVPRMLRNGYVYNKVMNDTKETQHEKLH